jgi:pimeloyl-ACP methyl ester carboxylesterase
MSFITAVIVVLVALLALVPISYVVEWLRPVPKTPRALGWASDLAIRYANLGGVQVRYIKAGTGPNLVLLHTLRTQLDIFAPVIPALAQHFTVYAYDYPGHGWSDIPKAAYAPEDFCAWTAALLEVLDIKDATVAGISIGGTIALVLAARGNPRIARVIAVNPYDYWPAAGVRTSSLAARCILMGADVPVHGATVMRLRNRFVSDQIMRGGVASPEALQDALAKEFYEVGNRPGHYRGFLSLLAHEKLWPQAREEYPAIKVPVRLVYGEADWAPNKERERTQAQIPGAAIETLANAGHFLSLDRPDELIRLISTCAKA